MSSTMRIGERTVETRTLYAGMVLAGLVFVSSLLLPVSTAVSRVVATLAFGVMSGLWLAHLAYEVLASPEESEAFDPARLLRLYTLIAAVSAVSTIVFASQFAGPQFAITAVAVGTVALVSVILGALVAGVQYIGAPVEESGTGEATTADPEPAE